MLKVITTVDQKLKLGKYYFECVIDMSLTAQSNVCSKISSIAFSGIYAQENVHRIAASLLTRSPSWPSLISRFFHAELTWSLSGVLLSVKNTWDELRILFSQEKVLALVGKYSCPLQAMLPSSCLTSQQPHQIHSTIQYCSQICHPSRNLALKTPSHFALLRDFNSFKKNSEGKQSPSQKTGAVI